MQLSQDEVQLPIVEGVAQPGMLSVGFCLPPPFPLTVSDDQVKTFYVWMEKYRRQQAPQGE